VTVRDVRLGVLKDIRSFDDRSRQSSFDVPLNVAMKQTDTWIVCHEANCHRATAWNNDNVSAHWRHWPRVGHIRDAWCSPEPVDDLEVMTVEMERVVSHVVVVDFHLDNGPEGKNGWVYLTIYGGVV